MRAFGAILCIVGGFGLGVSFLLWIGLQGGLIYPSIFVWLPSALIFLAGWELKRDRPKRGGRDREA